jgi:hypothetical protein
MERMHEGFLHEGNKGNKEFLAAAAAHLDIHPVLAKIVSLYG